jgi:arabinogalactan endo-1,4-beta-galactosidase
VVKAVPNGLGKGVFWWEATWTGVAGAGWDLADPTSGNGWENQALFAFDGTAWSPVTGSFRIAARSCMAAMIRGREH